MNAGRGKVIVGISLSLSGLEAVRFAVAEARRRRVPLAAVRAWTFNSGLRSGTAREWDRAFATEARTVITEAFRTAAGQLPGDLDVVVRVMSGPADVVLKDCVGSPDDLLVIGAARRRWLSGGVVRGCARDAGCPVVVVPRPELARAEGGRLAARRMVREAAASLTPGRGAGDR